MLVEQAKLLLAFWLRPAKAPSLVLDQGRIGFAIVLAILVAVALQTPATLADRYYDQEMQSILGVQDEETPKPLTPEQQAKLTALAQGWSGQRFGRNPGWVSFGGSAITSGALRSLLLWGGLFVPLSLAMLSLIERRPRTGLCVQQNFASLLCCTLFAWSAAFLPSAVLQSLVPWIPLVSYGYFLVLMVLSLRTVMGSRMGPAIGSVAGSVVLVGVAGNLSFYLGSLVYLLASPCLLYYLWGSFGTGLANMGGGLRRQQGFRRHLEALTLNERDADAHYQLGLIYADRKDWEQAEARFRRAAEIDPEDAEYAFHHGRALRELGKHDAAIRALEHAAKLNDKACSSEVWRELGAAYLALQKPERSEAALRKYVERREYDPAGLVLLGQALRALGQPAEAAQSFENAIKAAETMPDHRRGEARHWASRAKQELRSG